MKKLKHLISSLSIKNRMIISLTIILAASFITTNYLYYSSSHKSVRENLINSVLPLTRDNLYSEIQTNIIRPIFISSLMANDTFLKDWALDGERNIDVIKKYLDAIKKKYNFFSVFFVSEKSGKYYHYRGILKTISTADPHDVWYYDFKKLNREYDLDVDTDEAAGNKLTVFINHRLNGYNGEFLGVTGVGLNMASIKEMLIKHNSLYGNNIYLVDKECVVQVHSDEKIIGRTNIKDLPEMKHISEKIISGNLEPEIYEFERGERHILLTTRFIPEFDWYLFVEIDEDSRMSSILSSIKTNLVIGLILSCIIIAISIATANYFQKRISLIAVTDELTGAYNRKEFEIQFKKAVYSFNRNGTPFSVIIIDLDRFKEINDTLGHLTGDEILKSLAGTSKKTLRLTDSLFRWGGDEFIVITQGDIDNALSAAERLRKHFHESMSGFPGEKKPDGNTMATISCGVAEFTSGDSMDSLISRADSALYRAKTKGRNRVES
ncbi:MAG TPA: sensor domain-containing diguanylate cyclase [Spirochaetota bacterium]|nr:sensor domain-containing diguanylate cyclase [Spirochaetota bacterium]HPJ34338.1 sensor domain-containing diguanylate cyclase [Spirochaetota bacterium]